TLSVALANDDRTAHRHAQRVGKLFGTGAGVGDGVETGGFFKRLGVLNAKVQVVDRVRAGVHRHVDDRLNIGDVAHGDPHDVADAVGAVTRHAGFGVVNILRVDVDRRRANVVAVDAVVDDGGNDFL